LGRPEVVCSFEKVPAHRGVFGNEQADLLAKKGASDAFRKAMREL
jgi:ribonuclease HI